jgi:hypothetical protein
MSHQSEAVFIDKPHMNQLHGKSITPILSFTFYSAKGAIFAR